MSFNTTYATLAVDLNSIRKQFADLGEVPDAMTINDYTLVSFRECFSMPTLDAKDKIHGMRVIVNPRMADNKVVLRFKNRVEIIDIKAG